VEKTNGTHTNTSESTWKHVKVSLNPYNHKGDYIYILAQYIFRQICKAEDVETFCKFIEIVTTIRNNAWSDWQNPFACNGPSLILD
jgi:hypothetical protein